ncbi:MAG: YbfB/YjiJ family MFS transporter [Rhodospirillaceae bacterium]|jgi:predicted MFS family arabinose efflux permease|nr:YbfB/YjiJ family MFS transporter [Rhodospirillaceae bacterium]
MSMPAWLRLAIGGAATLLLGMGLGRFSYTPLLPAIIQDGALSAAEAGYVGAFNLGGYLVGALVTPVLRRRYADAPLLRGCLLVSLACLICSIFPLGFVWLAWWRFLVGVAVAVMMINSLSLVAVAAPPGVLGKATGVVFTGVGIGILFSGAVVPWLLGFSLTAAWAGLAAIGMVSALVAWWGWGPASREGAPAAAYRRPVVNGGVVRLVAAHGMYSIGLVPHSIYWVDYIARGLDQGVAAGGAQWVLVGVGAVGGTYLAGWLADRIGFGVALVLVFAVLAFGVALPVIVATPAALVASSLIFGAQPALSTVIAGRARQVVGPRDMPHVWRWMVLAVGLGQTVAGYGLVTLFNVTGSYTPVFLIGGAAMAAGALLSLPYWDRNPGSSAA